MTYLRIRNWERFQHYKHRRPIWIKLYVELLRDTDIQRLPIPTRLLWDQLLLLAAEYGNAIPNDPRLISELTLIPLRNVREGITELQKGRWLSQTKTTRRASTEKETETEFREKETPLTPLYSEDNLQSLGAVVAQLFPKDKTG